MEKKLELLLDYTRKMRDAQKAFFSTHHQEHLQESKKYERLVDKLIKDIDSGQGNLFDG